MKLMPKAIPSPNRVATAPPAAHDNVTGLAGIPQANWVAVHLFW
jgi:hypothetical protein